MFIVEIILIILGIRALANGHITWFWGVSASGGPVYLAAPLLFLPWPLGFVVGFYVSLARHRHNLPVLSMSDLLPNMLYIEGLLVVACIVLSMGVSLGLGFDHEEEDLDILSPRMRKKRKSRRQLEKEASTRFAIGLGGLFGALLIALVCVVGANRILSRSGWLPEGPAPVAVAPLPAGNAAPAPGAVPAPLPAPAPAPAIVPPPQVPVQNPAPPPVIPAPTPLPVPLATPKPKASLTEVRLPAPANDLAVGGNGRYLVAHLASVSKLAVFDVEQGKLTQEIPVPGGELLFAAGARQVIGLASDGTVRSWDLASGRPARSVPLPPALRTHIRQVCMGSGSAGPLFVTLEKEKVTLALDPETLRAVPVRWNHWSASNAYGPLEMRASPDGSLLLGWAGGWAGLDVALFRGGIQQSANDKIPFSMGLFALPSADGRFLYTPDSITSADRGLMKPAALQHAYLVPAHEPGFVLGLHSQGQRPLPTTPYGNRARPQLPPVARVGVYTDVGNPVFEVDCPEFEPGGDLYWERCVHYYPSRKMLVTLAGKDRFLVRHFE